VLAHESSIVQFRDAEPETVQRYDDIG
jgi:hypothetical protein